MEGSVKVYRAHQTFEGKRRESRMRKKFNFNGNFNGREGVRWVILKFIKEEKF